ncbi:VWA domain-containing protein [Isosphaeraceae bacterium EP7]
MSFGLAHALMLAGLAGLAIPPILHRLRRRPGEVVDWAAMQFLDEEPAARRRPRLDDLPLMLVRMATLGLIAVSLARPYLRSGTGEPGAGPGPRLVVLVLDGSASMGRRGAEGTPREAAVAWARSLLKRLEPGDRVALLLARDRVARVIDPPSSDLSRVAEALDALPPPRGSSDLPSAVGEALRILEGVTQPADLMLLTDHQRLAFRPDESARWQLLRDLRGRLPAPVRLWAPDFSPAGPAAGSTPDGSVGPVSVSRDPIAPGMTLTVSAEIANAGPGPLVRQAELLIDGQLASIPAQAVGPLPPGARAPVLFRASIADAGEHLLGIRLRPADDPNPVDDTSERPVTVRDALSALLVTGEPDADAVERATEFLRIALAPVDDQAPVVRARAAAVSSLTPTSLDGQSLVILAGVDRLPDEFSGPLARFVGQGGGLLVIPGSRAEVPGWVDQLGPRGSDLLPALPGDLKGEVGRREAVAHPAPSSFSGPVMAPLAAGDAPALGLADLYSYRVLRPLPGSTVAARLDNGDPWIVERPRGRGRVALLAGPLDANSGTLPINADFVPLVHEWAGRLGGPDATHRPVRPGEPLAFDLDPPPAADVAAPTITDPDGVRHPASIDRSAGRAVARLRQADIPGVYRLDPAGPRGRAAYATVAADPREPDPARLTPADAARLALGWPLELDSSPARLAGRLLAPRAATDREAWRPLLLLALGGLALEAWMSRLRAR